MIALRFYHDNDKSHLNYQLDEIQAQFSALPNHWFNDTRKTAYKIVICFDNQPIGFFVLDNGDDKYDYTDDDKALLLRSMSINPTFQGNGFGKLALLSLNEFIKTNQLPCQKIVLGVNHKNTTAQKLYEKTNFIKTERTFMGIKGLQYIYELDLNHD